MIKACPRGNMQPVEALAAMVSFLSMRLRSLIFATMIAEVSTIKTKKRLFCVSKPIVFRGKIGGFK
ncbi:hypothetical protein HMPREF0654_05245 [Prevotella disiens DNF00882]|uniref:Uncharacterized protein n=1 Tax=Prevotella disiens DNF00882 TaxID=1401075 RepID=A0A096C382_9BACT|nr:hypothetical protein HMPREF0654_05245 [Prevotella disiens DNF00882]